MKRLSAGWRSLILLSLLPGALPYHRGAAQGQRELKAYLAGLGGKKVYLKQAIPALAAAAGTAGGDGLSLDLAALDPKQLEATSIQEGLFVFPIEYTIAPFSDKAYDKKSDTIRVELSGERTPKRITLGLRGIWKLKTGAVAAAEHLLEGLFFFADKTDEFARNIYLDHIDKAIIAKCFKPFPRLEQLSQTQKESLLRMLKRAPGMTGLRFQMLGDDIYSVQQLGRFPVLTPAGDSDVESELDRSRWTQGQRVDRAMESSIPAIKQVGQRLGSTAGITGICFELEVWHRDHRKDNYAGGTQLVKAARMKEIIDLFVPSECLRALGRDEIVPDAFFKSITIKVDGRILRRPDEKQSACSNP
ncbi:MAG: hypothetical protein HY650_08050 [Acidobacteria bacterium]|nr:hypothetical protein [Acidobacteriota bacterium]